MRSSDSFGQLAAISGYSVDGSTVISGIDPKAWAFSRIAQDADNLPPSFKYYETVRQRLHDAAGFHPVFDWTGKNKLPDFGVEPETAEETKQSEKIEKVMREEGIDYAEAAKKIGQGFFDFGKGFFDFGKDTLQTGGTNLIIIVVAITLLAIAAYSVIVPPSARSEIATLLTTRGLKG